MVNGYLHSYEVSLSDGEIAYAQGVAQAEINADAHMGSLDGRWTVVAEDGVSLLSLVLSDAGEDVPVEEPGVGPRRRACPATWASSPTSIAACDIST